MDYVQTVVTALTLGAGLLAQPITDQLVQDAYEALKEHIASRREYQDVDIKALENNPKSTDIQTQLASQFKAARADDDKELIHNALQLLQALQVDHPSEPTGVKVIRSRAREALIEDIQAPSGVGVQLTNVTIEESLTIRGVRSGADTPKANKSQED